MEKQDGWIGIRMLRQVPIGTARVSLRGARVPERRAVMRCAQIVWCNGFSNLQGMPRDSLLTLNSDTATPMTRTLRSPIPCSIHVNRQDYPTTIV